MGTLVSTLVSAVMTATVALAQRIQVESFLASSIAFLGHHNPQGRHGQRLKQNKSNASQLHHYPSIDYDSIVSVCSQHRSVHV